MDGELLNTVVYKNNVLYADGKVIGRGTINSIESKDLFSTDLRSLVWGPPNEFSETITITGLTSIVIAAAILLVAPHIGISRSIVWAGYALVGGYNEIEISGEIRYASDDEFLYYERETNLVVNGNTELDSFYDTGKTSLN